MVRCRFVWRALGPGRRFVYRTRPGVRTRRWTRHWISSHASHPSNRSSPPVPDGYSTDYSSAKPASSVRRRSPNDRLTRQTRGAAQAPCPMYAWRAALWSQSGGGPTPPPPLTGSSSVLDDGHRQAAPMNGRGDAVQLPSIRGCLECGGLGHRVARRDVARSIRRRGLVFFGQFLEMDACRRPGHLHGFHGDLRREVRVPEAH